MRCRHERNSWLLCGARWEWCYRCGSIRRMRPVGENAYEADTGWLRPVGPDGDNPVVFPSDRKRRRAA